MTKLITLSRDLAWAAAQDAGCRAMRKANRTAWNVDDYNEAIRTFNRVWPENGNLPERKQEPNQRHGA